jgi:hypothetical protein
MTRQKIFTVLLILLLLSSCMRVRLDAPPALPTAQEIESVKDQASAATGTASPVPPTATATAGLISPTATIQPRVVISAVGGNLFIRRGPDMAYNPIGVLYEGWNVPILARDMLSKWAQIVIPNSEETGWVSLQTKYSRVDGDLKSLPEFTFTDWPIPAYVRNCTHHQMYILPAEIVLPSSYNTPDNMIWLIPGSYTVYDIDVAGEPEVLEFELREGVTVEILEDGAGEHRKCP